MGATEPHAERNARGFDGLLKDVRLVDIFSGVWPFLAALLLALALVLKFQALALWLPSLMA